MVPSGIFRLITSTNCPFCGPFLICSRPIRYKFLADSKRSLLVTCKNDETHINGQVTDECIHKWMQLKVREGSLADELNTVLNVLILRNLPLSVECNAL